MEELTNIMQSLQAEITSLSKEKRNAIQERFVKEFSKDTPDQKQLLALLQEEKIFENLSFDKKDKELIKKLIEDLQESAESESDTPKKPIRYFRTELNNQTIEIFLPKLDKSEIPIEILDFVNEVEDVQDIIKENCKKSEEIDKYLYTLEGIAQVGGTSTYNVFAQKRLQVFKENFVASKWWSLKLPFIKELGFAALLIVGICLFFIFILKLGGVSDAFLDRLSVDKHYLTNWFYMLMGSSVGTWITFSLVRQQKTNEEIKILRDNIPHPYYRLAIMGLVTSVFYLIFITGFFNIQIGDDGLLSTKCLGNKNCENLALLIGIFIGFSENTIGNSLQSRIESFTSKL